MFRGMFTGAALLALAACGYGASGGPDEAGQQEAPVTSAEEGAMPDFEMPTPEEAAAAAAEAQARAEEGVIYAGASLKGGAVSVPLGETLRIELQTVPTAGYVWEITEQPDFLELTGEKTRATDPAHQSLPGFTGGNHYMSFDLKASAPGEGVVRMKEARPWETEEEPMDTYELTVTVAARG